MRPHAAMNECKRLLAGGLLLITCLLSGCVAFEHVPETLECDPMLAGRWIPLDEVDRPDIDAVTIDHDCQAVFPPPDRGSHESHQMVLRSFALDDWKYLVFSPHDVERIYGLEVYGLAALGDASILLRYRIDGDVLQGWVVNSDVALQAAANGRLDLRTIERDLYLVGGNAQSTARVLRNQSELFESASDKTPAVHLRRVSAASP